MPQTRAQANRAIRQEALREQLSNGKHLDHVIAMANQLADLEAEMDAGEVMRLDKAISAKMRLVNKYLPDLKAMEVTGEDGGPVITKTVISFVQPDS